MSSIDLKDFIADVPDFPSPGILFRDLTPLLKSPEALAATLDLLEDHARRLSPSAVIGIESRGFLFGAPLALRLGVGFVPVRKPGKLPRATFEEAYALEYGEDRLQLHADALAGGDSALIVDDLLATGGTARATARLIERSGARVAGALFVVELAFLDGRARLGDIPTTSLVTY